MTRALLFTVTALALTGCQIDDADVPKFGGPCSNGCANGFRCDKDLDACVPEEEPTDAGFVDAGFPDAGNPELFTFTVEADGQAAGASVNVERDEEFTLSWTTRDVTDCSISNGVGPVGPNGTRVLSLATPGTHSYELTCTGNGDPFTSDPVTVNVDTVLDGDLIVTSVADLDAAVGLTEVTGNVVLDGASVAGVTQLATLTTVGGDVRFVNTDGVTTFELPALATVGGSLVLTDSQSETTALRFPALTSVGEDVLLENLSDVEELYAPSLGTIGRDLYIGRRTYPAFPDIVDDNNCQSLAVSRGVPALTTVDLTSLVSVGRDFGTEEATALTPLSLPALQTIGDTLFVYQLGEFTGGKAAFLAPALTSVATAVFHANSNLGTIDMRALDHTTRVPAADAPDFDAPLTGNLPSPLFHVLRMVAIDDCFYGLYVPTTGDLFFQYNGIEANEAIDELRLDALTTLAGGLVWNGSSQETLALPLLETAEFVWLEYGGTTQSVSFPALTTITDGGLSLYDLPTVTSYAFPSLVDIEGSVILTPGTQVTTFSLAATDVDHLQLRSASQAVMDGLALVTVSGMLEINGEYTGTTLSGLTALTTVGGDLNLAYVDSVADFVGLEQLTSVGGDFSFPASVTSTAGLESLQTVGSLDVANAELLPALSLPALTSITSTYTNLDANFYSPSALTDVSLPALETVAGSLVFVRAPLTSLDLGTVTQLAGLSLGYTALVDLHMLCPMTANSGNLSLYFNDQLTSIDGLQNLTSIDRLYGRALPVAAQCKVKKLIENTNVTDIDLDFAYGGIAACDFDIAACP